MNAWGGGWMWGFGGLLVPLVVWSLLWTGLALWHAARRGERGWFIFFLLVHTAGILELVYLVFIAHTLPIKKTSASKRHC